MRVDAALREKIKALEAKLVTLSSAVVVWCIWLSRSGFILYRNVCVAKWQLTHVVHARSANACHDA